MESTYIFHDIPGRLRVRIPVLSSKEEYLEIEHLFALLKGVRKVRIEPTISSMVIEYQSDTLRKSDILGYISLIFKQTIHNPLNRLAGEVRPNIRKSILRSAVSGVLLLIAYTQKTILTSPGFLDYAAVISTAYTVLSHGENNLGHPDVVTGIVSMLSLGNRNILQVTLVTWIVNLLEIVNDIRRSNASLL